MISQSIQINEGIEEPAPQENDFLPQGLDSLAYDILRSIQNLRPCTEADFTSSVCELEGLFEELETLAGKIAPQQWTHLVSNERIGNLLPEVYAIRSELEYRSELATAREMLSSANPEQAVAGAVQKKISMLSPGFFEELRDRQRVLFVGSGPFPTTAMAIVEVLQCSVTCLDRNGAANAIARDFVAVGAMSNRIEFVEGTLELFDDIVLYDSIVCAFLLGVDTVAAHRNKKSLLVNSVAEGLAPGAQMLLRTPLGAGELVYPKIDFADRPGFESRVYPSQAEGPLPYDLPFMIIEREKAEASNGR